MGGVGVRVAGSLETNLGATGRAQPVTTSVVLAGHLNSQPLCVLISRMWMVTRVHLPALYESLRRDRG